MKLYFEKRKSLSLTALVLVPAVSFITSLVLTGFLLLAFRVNPLATYRAMFLGAFGSASGFGYTLVKAIPLMLLGLGVAVAFKLRFWNIGAEGQLVMAGIGTSWVAIFWSTWLPPFLVLPLALLVGSAFGALWAGIPALLKVTIKVDETLVTLMLNYVAILFAQFLFYGPWIDPNGMGFPGSALFPESAWLPRIFGPASIGIVFALILAIVLWVVMNKTRWGFELRIIGANPASARYQGISVKRNIFLGVLLSGALCGLAGACEATGIGHRLQEGLSLGYGYTAIIVAWMAVLNPLAIIPVAVLIAGLLVGGDAVQMKMHLPKAMSLVLQGMILFPMLAGSLFTEYTVRRERKSRTATPAAGKGAA